MENKQLEHEEVKINQVKYPVCILAHDMDVPMNIGSIFRIADALGLEKIYLTGNSAQPPNSKIRKTSRSTEKYVSYSYSKNPDEVIQQLKLDGYMIVSLEITSASKDIRNFKITAQDKICLIIGAENAGVSQELLDASHQTLHIPMAGQNSSMNVATACAIAVFEITRNYIS